MERTIKFSVNAVRWFDKINGNTYHSVNITRLKDGANIAHEWTYGYDDFYKQTALKIMSEAKWLPVKYRGKYENGFPKCFDYEREKNYPILWNVSNGLKREMIANGRI